MNGVNNMNRVNYHQHIDLNKAEILHAIHSSQLALKLIKDLKLTEEEILKNCDKILFFASQNECCLYCKGLKDCKKSKKGYQLSLSKESDSTLLVETMQICEYYQDYAAKNQNLLYSIYDIETIYQNYKFEEYKEICLQLPQSFKEMYKNLYRKITTKGCYLQLKETRKRKKLEIGLLSTFLEFYTCSLIKTSQFIADLKSLFSNKTGYEELMNSICQAQVLIVDDLGGESVTAWSRDEVLLSIFNYRLDHNLVTIFISEFELEQLPLLYALQKDYLKVDKFISKIKESIYIDEN